MNILDKIVIDNLVVFKHAEFPIEPGISAIRGKNMDSKAKNYNGNACGKSLMFGAFSNVINHAPPMAEKKNSASTFLPDKARISLHMRLRAGAVNIEQFRKGKSVQYAVSVNKKPQKVRTPTEMRKAVTNLIPTSEAIIYSTVLVSSFRPPILWLGTSAQRYDFFEDIAELGYYDVMAAKISKKIAECKLQEKLMEPWRSDLEELRQVYTGKKQLKHIAKQIKLVEDRLKKLREKFRKFEKQSDFDEEIVYKYFATPRLALDAYKAAKEAAEGLREKGKKLAAKLEKLEFLAEQQPTYLKWMKQIENLPKNKTSEVRSLIRQLEAKIVDISYSQSIVDRFEEDADFYDDKNLANLKGPKPDIAVIEKLEEDYKFQNHQKQLFKEWHETGTCPICKSTDRKIKSLVATYGRKELDYMILLYRKYKFEENKDYHKAVWRLTKAEKIKKSLDAARKLLSDCERRKTLLENPVEKPKKLVKKSELEELKDKIETIKAKFVKQRSRFNKLESTHDMYLKYAAQLGKDADLKSLAVTLKKSAKIKRNKHNEIIKAEDELVSLRTQLESVKQARISYNKLNSKYKEAKRIADELPDWQVLHKAYGPIGMRVEHMQSLVAGYVKYLNNLAPLVYSEPMEFSAKLEGRNFNLIVTRHKNPSDVRYLSGAQSRLFIAISAVALRKMLPESKRFNFLAFDEIDAGVSSGEMDKFTNVFLPFIQEEISSIFIITPKSKEEWSIPNASNINFVREKGITTIKTQSQMQSLKLAA